MLNSINNQARGDSATVYQSSAHTHRHADTSRTYLIITSQLSLWHFAIPRDFTNTFLFASLQQRNYPNTHSTIYAGLSVLIPEDSTGDTQPPPPPPSQHTSEKRRICSLCCRPISVLELFCGDVNQGTKYFAF